MQLLPYVRSGKLKALAVTSATRWPSAPEVPTMAEAGYPNFAVKNWIGFVMPAGTPKPIVRKLSGAADKAIKNPEVTAKLQGLGLEGVGGSPEQFDAFIHEERQRWAKLIKDVGIKPE